MTAVLVVGGVIILLMALLLALYNRLIKLRNRVQATWADLDVQLERRAELIPNLVTVVKGYATHERKLIDALTFARESVQAAEHPNQRAAAEQRLGVHTRQVIAIAEAYPDLKADARFRDLSDELIATENKIAFSRQLYNDTVNAYADTTQSVPGVIVARPLGFEVPPLFAAEPATRVAPPVPGASSSP